MVQTLKPERRERLMDAAEEVFARDGYEGATIAEIARAAGVSAANVYLYFANKDALFYEVFSDAFVATFLRLVKRRVAGLSRVKELTALDAEAESDAQELLRFWIDHRLKVVTILDRARGSRHEGFRALFVAELMRPTLAKLRADAAAKHHHRPARPHRLDARARFVLERIFDNTVQMIVSILEHHAEESDIRAAISAFWSYQLAGLSGFTKRVTT